MSCSMNSNRVEEKVISSILKGTTRNCHDFTPRNARVAPGGMILHVLNRENARDEIFSKKIDYEAFGHVLTEMHLSRCACAFSFY